MALLPKFEKATCEAINRFVQVAFKTQDSLFTPRASIWSPEVRADLYERFVSHADLSPGVAFMPKYEKQLKGAPHSTIQLAAELLYAQLLIPVPAQIKPKTKVSHIETVLSWSGEPVVHLPDDLKDGLNKGLSGGQAFVQQRPFHLAFILETLKKWDGVDRAGRQKLLSDAWDFRGFLKDVPAKAAQAMREILCFFVHPSYFEAITSGKVKKKIVGAFRGKLQSPNGDDDKDILDIRKVLSKEYGEGFSFFQPEIKSLWDKDSQSTAATNPEGGKPPVLPELPMKALLEQIGQIILYGPPGTGKTREAKRLALALLTGNESTANEAYTDDDIEDQLKPFKKDDRFNLVVFHPAYEYEQFVGGIEPKLTGQQIAFEAKAGVFTQLCRKAKEDKDERPAALIIDEINRGNLPKLLGELVYALEYRGHEVRLPFDDDRPNLVVPKNLYIIATMNSADRSIGHIDVAIRRRFGLYPLEPNSEVVREVWSRAGDKVHGIKLAALMDQINKKLRSGPDAGAAECGVGQSYFLPKPEASGEIAKNQVEMKWKYQVQPLLREYEQLLNVDAHSLQEFFKPLDQCLGQP
jgi:AAA domain (dynein-related subfamily)